MNTKHRILSVLLILATVATLCVVMAAPAGALTAGAVTLTVPTVSTASQYTINFTTGSAGALVAADTVSVVFPLGTDATGANTTIANFNGGTYVPTSVTWTAATASVGPIAVLTGGTATASTAKTVIITAAAVVKNPATAGVYRLQVATSKESTPKYSQFYTVGAAASQVAAGGATAVVPARGGSAAAYSIPFTSNGAGAALTAGAGVVTILFPAGTTVPDYIAASNVRVNSVVPTVAPYTFNNASLTSALTNPKGVSIVVPNTIAAGTLITIDFNSAAGIVNPTTVGNYQVLVFTSSDGVEVADPVYAIGSTISISPTSGAAGTTITIVGGGFAPMASVDIYADVGSNNTFIAGTDPIIGSTTASATGTINTTVTASAYMALNIGAVDGAGTNAAAAQTFTLGASLSASPASGLVTTKVTASGSNFTKLAGNTIGAVMVGTTLLGFVATEAALTPGTYCVISNTMATTGLVTIKLMVPAGASAGSKTIVISESDPAGKYAAAYFNVSGASVTLSPTSGPVGTTVTVTGVGFAASQAAIQATGIQITTYLGTIKTVVTSFATDGDGNMTATFTVPAQDGAAPPVAVNPGTATVLVTDAATRAATGYFTVTPATIALSANSGVAGGSLTITGSGFAAYSTVALTFDAANVTPIPSPLTDGLGNFTATITVPGLGASAHTVTATVGAAAPTQIYTITASTATVTSGLSSISGKYSIVWSFDAASQSWKMFDTTAGATSTLTGMARGQGYWINVTADCNVVYGGNSYALKAGWNLIGWLG